MNQNFQKIFFDNFERVCPLIAPINLFAKLRDPTLKTEDIRLLIGYRVVNGQYESFDLYAARVSALIALYAGITQTDSFLSSENKYGITNGWKWMATILNSPPLEISSALLCVFIEVRQYLC
jgi:hypothetical protein